MTTAKGGYQTIDFKNQNLTTAATVIKGIHNSIEGNHRKPLLLSNLVINGVEQADTFSTANTSGGNYVLSANGATITVTTDDNVTSTAVSTMSVKAVTTTTKTKE